MDFDGFSSSEDDESEGLPPPPPLPPDPVTPRENRTVPDAAPQKSSHGGFRGGGRPAVTLPEGCKSFFTEAGVEKYSCSCNRIFQEKKNLIRHFEYSCGMRTPVIKASKRRRTLSFSENNDAQSASDLDPELQVTDSCPITVFNEDEEGSKLLECEYQLFSFTKLNTKLGLQFTVYTIPPKLFDQFQAQCSRNSVDSLRITKLKS